MHICRCDKLFQLQRKAGYWERQCVNSGPNCQTGVFEFEFGYYYYLRAMLAVFLSLEPKELKTDQINQIAGASKPFQ